MAMITKNLGKERWTLHSRVKHIAESNDYNEKDGFKLERLCEFQLNEKEGFQWDCYVILLPNIFNEMQWCKLGMWKLKSDYKV